MSKKLIIIISAIVVVLGGAVGGYLVFSKLGSSGTANTNAPSNGFNLNSVTQTISNEPDAIYTDDSGYSFSYPSSITVKDTTPNDNTYYSQLELSKSGQTLKVAITDGNLDPYKSNKTASLIGSTLMGGITANQYSVSGRLVSVAIDQGVLYVIDGPQDGGFWESSQNKLLQTFKFAGQAGSGTAATDSSGSTDANTSYEEETVQ